MVRQLYDFLARVPARAKLHYAIVPARAKLHYARVPARAKLNYAIVPARAMMATYSQWEMMPAAMPPMKVLKRALETRGRYPSESRVAASVER